MLKPRIIIADCDFEYIGPLHQKFVENFFDRINIEIITDANYFTEFFSLPQKIDLLIISESLMTDAVKMQNIGKVFILSEDMDSRNTDRGEEKTIYKYSRLNEIYSTITSSCPQLKATLVNEDREPQIIMTYSAVGGSGKTTSAMGIASCLSNRLKQVLYINTTSLQAFHSWLDDKSDILDSADYALFLNSGESFFDDIKHILRTEKFTYLPPFRNALLSIGMNGMVYRRLILEAKKSRLYDYIVVDTDSVFDEKNASLLEIADKVVILVKPTEAGVEATNMLVNNINGSLEEKYIYVSNDIGQFNTKEENQLFASSRFKISERIEYIEDCSKLTVEDLDKNEDMARLSYVIE